MSCCRHQRSTASSSRTAPTPWKRQHIFLNLIVKSDKPVVLVGSMRPSTAVSADGPLNLYNAVAVAGDPNAKGRGVLVVMNDWIHGAHSLTKTSTTDVQTFMSPLRGLVGVVAYGKDDFYNVPPWKNTTSSEFDISNVTKLPRVDIVFADVDMSPDLIDASVNAGAKGIVIAGVGNGNMNKASVDAAARAVKKGVVVVRASRVVTGLVGRNVEVNDDELGFVASDELNPQKARILLTLALLNPRPRRRFKRCSTRTDRTMAHGGISVMKALPLLLVMIALAVTPMVCSCTGANGSAFQSSFRRSSEHDQTLLLRPPATAAPTPASPPQKGAQEPNIENTAEAAEPLPKRDLVHWNEYQGPHFTIRVGAGFLYDFAAFAQDKDSKEQIAMLPGEKVRDSRIIMGGRFPSLPLPTTWCAGVMYDGPTNSLVSAANRDHVRGPEDLELLLHWAPKGGLLSQQGHGRLRRLDHGEIHDERRDHSAAGGRYQVAWLFKKAWLSLEPRLLQRCGVQRASRFLHTPARRSHALRGCRCIRRRRAR